MDSPQDLFWAGDFGKEYAQRNDGHELLAVKTAIFSKIISRTHGVKSVRELGANIGLNIQALQRLIPKAAFQAVEINLHAYEQLRTLPNVQAFHQSLLDPIDADAVDLAFTAGVLIHIAPARLEEAYARLYEAATRYILVIEYYSPDPVMIPYRGYDERLYKRDFAGELLERYRDLRLVGYGFSYKNDKNFPGGDDTWFLMEKEGRQTLRHNT